MSADLKAVHAFEDNAMSVVGLAGPAAQRERGLQAQHAAEPGAAGVFRAARAAQAARGLGAGQGPGQARAWPWRQGSGGRQRQRPQVCLSSQLALLKLWCQDSACRVCDPIGISNA